MVHKFSAEIHFGGIPFETVRPKSGPSEVLKVKVGLLRTEKKYRPNQGKLANRVLLCDLGQFPQCQGLSTSPKGSPHTGLSFFEGAKICWLVKRQVKRKTEIPVGGEGGGNPKSKTSDGLLEGLGLDAGAEELHRVPLPPVKVLRALLVAAEVVPLLRQLLPEARGAPKPTLGYQKRAHWRCVWGVWCGSLMMYRVP